jgi:hypothetical protein
VLAYPGKPVRLRSGGKKRRAFKVENKKYKLISLYFFFFQGLSIKKVIADIEIKMINTKIVIFVELGFLGVFLKYLIAEKIAIKAIPIINNR